MPNAYVQELEAAIDAPLAKSLLTVSKKFWLAVGFCAFLFGLGLIAWGYQIFYGLAVSGKKIPIGWTVYITDLVFWVGIAHSGTLISAFLFFFRAKFRLRFNRAAEAMTVFAIMVAGLCPLIHMGRVQYFYWLLPYPNQRMIWPNFRSPLVWDVFAINAYMVVSIIFLYVGMIPDLAMIRRRASGLRKYIYGALSLGWEGTASQWQLYHQTYRLLALCSAPLVICVSGVVSWDFAMSVIPGWHSTVFPAYFVAGALFSGLSMVFTLVIPLRKIFQLEKFITLEHFEKLSLLLLFTAMIVWSIYAVEFGYAIYSGNLFERSQFVFRATGAYREVYWLMMGLNVLLPASLMIKKLRRNLSYLFVISIFINVGMWLERFTIVVMSTSHDYDPYIWRTYTPTLTEFLITLGTFGLFFMLFLLFTKVFPILAVTEIKEQGL